MSGTLQTISDVDAMLVAWIRQKCAREFNLPRETPFFSAHAQPGESADETLLRVFRECCEAERDADPDISDDDVLLVMIFG